MPTPKIWFITGASSGFGLAMTRLALNSGDKVVATLRDPSVLSSLASQYPEDRLLILKLDVANRAEIVAAFDKTKEVFGRLDVVFNNAGYAVLAEIENTPDDLARRMFDVDFWGATYVTQEAVKFFREVNEPGVGGRIIQNSSIGGIFGSGAVGFYCAAKHALEAISESLALELDPSWNIKITIVEPGAFRTDAVKRSMIIAPPHPAYNRPESPAVIKRQYFTNSDGGNGDPEKAAKVLYKLVQLPDPPLRLPLGKDSVRLYKSKIDWLKTDVENFEGWSDDIEFEK